MPSIWSKEAPIPTNNHLYRGETEQFYTKRNGKLMPLGTTSEIIMTRGDSAKGVDMLRNGEFLRRNSWVNAVRAHQLKSGFANGCYISTTKDINVAKYYATNGGQTNGYIFVLDRNLFTQHGVVEQEFPNPRYPKELEISIRAANNGEIPKSVIKEVKRVTFPF